MRLLKRAELDVSAASGLVVIDDWAYVVADDALELVCYRFTEMHVMPSGRCRLLDRPQLPADHHERKREKPDFEAICRIDPSTLFAFGSGSTPQRRVAVRVELTGQIPRVSTRLDADALYAHLDDRFGGVLNLEGAARVGDRLFLGQRGGGGIRGPNALIELDLARGLVPDAVVAIHALDLGVLDGIPLGLTDLAPLGDGRLVFSAAAEASDNAYDDGVCQGSVLGILEGARIDKQERVEADPYLKIEGVSVTRRTRDAVELLCVADADDPKARAPLLAAKLTL